MLEILPLVTPFEVNSSPGRARLGRRRRGGGAARAPAGPRGRRRPAASWLGFGVGRGAHLWTVRSRLYRGRMLQLKAQFAVLFKSYKNAMLLHRSKVRTL